MVCKSSPFRSPVVAQAGTSTAGTRHGTATGTSTRTVRGSASCLAAHPASATATHNRAKPDSPLIALPRLDISVV
ncbi:hypothetical protein [Pseudomonas phage vB_Pae_SG_WM_Sew_P27]